MKERERVVRDLQASLKEASERLSKYDGQPESEQIRQRMLDLEVSGTSSERAGERREWERTYGHTSVNLFWSTRESVTN